jgi:hypothetical protein
MKYLILFILFCGIANADDNQVIVKLPNSSTSYSSLISEMTAKGCSLSDLSFMRLSVPEINYTFTCANYTFIPSWGGPALHISDIVNDKFSTTAEKNELITGLTTWINSGLNSSFVGVKTTPRLLTETGINSSLPVAQNTGLPAPAVGSNGYDVNAPVVGIYDSMPANAYDTARTNGQLETLLTPFPSYDSFQNMLNNLVTNEYGLHGSEMVNTILQYSNANVKGFDYRYDPYDAIEWFKSKGVQLLNLSLTMDSTLNQLQLDAMIAAARIAGMDITQGVGNYERNPDGSINWELTWANMAKYDNPFSTTVGEVDPLGNPVSPCYLSPQFATIAVDIVAVGKHTVGQNNTQISGSSLSTAAVTGMKSEMLRRNPWMTPDEIAAATINSTKLFNNRPVKDACTGYGPANGDAMNKYAERNFTKSCSDTSYTSKIHINNWVNSGSYLMIQQGMTPLQACTAYIGSPTTSANYNSPPGTNTNAYYSCFNGLTHTADIYLQSPTTNCKTWAPNWQQILPKPTYYFTANAGQQYKDIFAEACIIKGGYVSIVNTTTLCSTTPTYTGPQYSLDIWADTNWPGNNAPGQYSASASGHP